MKIHSNHNVSQIQYHFVFVTKYRRNWFKFESTRNFIKYCLHNIAKQKNIFIKNLEIMENHIHLLCQSPSNYSSSYLASLFKSSVTRELRKKYPFFKKLKQIFTPSFYVGSCGNVSQKTIYKYIQNQRGEDIWKKQFNVA